VTSGDRRSVGDISAFEYPRNVDRVTGDRNSNPYAVLGLSDRTIVADAGANSILDVRNGRVSLLAVIPKNGNERRASSPQACARTRSLFNENTNLQATKTSRKVRTTGNAPGPKTGLLS